MLTGRGLQRNSKLEVIARYLTNTLTDVEKSTLKPLTAIPGPKPKPIVGNLLDFIPGIGDYDANNFKSYVALNEQYGDMVKMKLPTFNIVFLFSPQLVREAFMKEGKYPNRPGMDALEKHRRSKPPEIYANVGLLVEQGELWKDIRSKVQKHMARMTAVHTYAEPISIVTNDFIERLKRLRRPNMEVDDFLNEMMKWALESIGVVTLSRRLGCLSDSLTKDSEPQKVIDSVLTSFKTLHNLEMSLGAWKLISTPNYRSLVKAQDYFETVIIKYLKTVVENIKDDSSNTNNILNAILMETNMDIRKITGMVMDTFLAGVDTSSVSSSFLFYELSLYPEKQEKLYQEIRKIIPDRNAMITPEDLGKLEYLGACIKESMRLHPVTVGTARVFDRDIEINGYHIPSKTKLASMLVTIGRNGKYFHDPDKFLPERWLKAEVGRENVPSQFAHLPFGYGSRMCVGFRLAEQEIRILVCKVLQNFRIEYHNEPIGQNFGIILGPNKPFKLKFYDREE